MPIKINSNIPSMNAQKNLNRIGDNIKTPLERMSSGKRINSAKDDAAGLAIVARLATQILGNNVAIRNTNDGISLAQTAEGALQETSNMLQRMRELAVQSVNATNSPSDRRALQQEAEQLTSEVNRVASTTEFNGQKLLDGSFGTALFQVGANANETIAATTGNFKTNQYGNYQLSGEANSVAATDRITVGGNINITSTDGSASVAYSAGDSAKAVAESVNQTTEQTGVTASATTETSLSFSAAGNYQLNITADNGTTETVNFSIDNATGIESLSQAAAAFNDSSNSTGVVASVNDDGSGITLIQAEGESITISDTSNANAGDVTVSAGASSQTLTSDGIVDTTIATGEVTFNANQSFTTTSTAGAVTANASDAAQLSEVANVDISSVDQANQALSTIDAAISRVAMQRAEFGALQSKFESTVRNTENYSINLSAARSRIEDTDYAKESAELIRATILQKAGIAMLGQANITPQMALGLLGKK